MDFGKLRAKLLLNSKTACTETVRLLIKIAENIMKDPLNPKYRILQKNNRTIAAKILNTEGGLECLQSMGFLESDLQFTLPQTASMKRLENIKNNLMDLTTPEKVASKLSESPASSSQHQSINNVEYVQPIVLPPLKFDHPNKFLKNIAITFHGVLNYENKGIQDRARKLIPTVTLEETAIKQFRMIQGQAKKDRKDCTDVSVQDLLILQLLNWFKTEFFSWVDSPECSFCGGQTKMSHMSTDPKLMIYTDRVEIHKCSSCNKLTPFCRYDDLNILLETRRGRCGEWANTFTLFCHAMGWDARYVVDETDHVWTEVFSFGQNRWLHCDPCENVCDTPLMYESGWGKKVSYVMAYSTDDIQDVTWRYSSQHKQVLTRRKNCTERELLETILSLRAERQKNLSLSKKQYLVKRTLNELSEFLCERKPGDSELQGRSSGASSWRLARGEIDDSDVFSSHTWLLTNEDLHNNEITLRYSAALDQYELISGMQCKTMKKRWSAGIFDQSNLFRKEEKDWNNVYLARKEGTNTGSISWKFVITEGVKKISKISIAFSYTTFEDGNVDVQMCSEKTCLLLPNDKKLETADFAGSNSLVIKATLSKGRGDVAWQHAQLFRQSSDSKDHPFQITITFA